MFTLLEEARRNFNVEDYSLSQTSLEQVFLRFAAEQHTDELEREGIFRSLDSTANVSRLDVFAQCMHAASVTR